MFWRKTLKNHQLRKQYLRDRLFMEPGLWMFCKLNIYVTAWPKHDSISLAKGLLNIKVTTCFRKRFDCDIVVPYLLYYFGGLVHRRPKRFTATLFGKVNVHHKLNDVRVWQWEKEQISTSFCCCSRKQRNDNLLCNLFRQFLFPFGF